MKKILIISLVTLLLWVPFEALAKSDVNAVYKKHGPGKVDIAVTISGDAPKAIIVKQQVPSGNSLLSAKPKPKSNNKKESATWMFKRVNTGNIKISMKFEKDIDPASLNGEIRFKQKGSGDMIIKKIR